MPEAIKNHENIEEYETKKFVFHIYDENIDFVESLPSNQKNVLINQLIYDYRVEDIKNKKSNELRKFYKKTAMAILLVVIGVPLFLMLINFSLNVTLNSYSQMQNNFQKLFD